MTADAQKLEPCPFCGGTPYIHTMPRKKLTSVRCSSCQFGIGDAERWNRRAALRAPDAGAVAEVFSLSGFGDQRALIKSLNGEPFNIGQKLYTRPSDADALLREAAEHMAHHPDCDQIANGIDGDCPCGMLLKRERIKAHMKGLV